MAHYARLDESNVVIRVHVIDNRHLWGVNDTVEDEQRGADYLTRLHGEGNWKQTSYNTIAGEHPSGNPLRANYCGAGWAYSEEHDIFHPAQPYPSWSLDTVKGQWNPPVPMPEVEEGEDGRPRNFWRWNEEEQQWDEITMEDNNG